MLPVEVVFQKLRRTESAERRIHAKAQELATFHPALTRCRVLVDVPHRHRTGGNRYRVRIELSLPRRKDLVIEHGPAARRVAIEEGPRSLRKADEVDAMFADLSVATQDAFEAARRRLQDVVRRQRATARARASAGRRRLP